MAQKTKDELKAQAKSLLETEGNDKTDWIDTFATEADVNRVYGYDILSGSSEIVHVRRTGHIVTMDGSFFVTNDVKNGYQIDGLVNQMGYRIKLFTLANAVLYTYTDESKSSLNLMNGMLMSTGMGAWYNETKGYVMAKNNSFFMSVTGYTDDPLPDDSEIIG